MTKINPHTVSREDLLDRLRDIGVVASSALHSADASMVDSIAYRTMAATSLADIEALASIDENAPAPVRKVNEALVLRGLLAELLYAIDNAPDLIFSQAQSTRAELDELETQLEYEREQERKRRIRLVVEDAQQAFWREVAAEYPEAKSGDLDPYADTQLTTAMTQAVERWVNLNTAGSDDE